MPTALEQPRSQGALGYAFAPNLGSVDYGSLFTDPESWSDLRSRISAFKVYADNVRADEPSDRIGGNTYGALRDWGLFPRLRDWELPLHVEHGAVKEWENPELHGEELRASTRQVVARVREGGGEVAIICMDEPLASKVNADGEHDPRRFGPERVGDVARMTAEYARAAMELGPQVSLLEAYPHHPAERIEGFLRDVVEANQLPLAFFELDIDLYAIRNKRLSTRQLNADFGRLRATCERHQIPFRVIATGTHARSSQEYRAETLEIMRLVRQRLAIPLDGVTVQSWVVHNLRGDIPPNFPRSDPNSHLSLLAEVMAFDQATG